MEENFEGITELQQKSYNETDRQHGDEAISKGITVLTPPFFQFGERRQLRRVSCSVFHSRP
jgi:hypothetical protein